MAEKKSWRDYSKTYSEEDSTEKSTSSKKTGTWRDYSTDFNGTSGVQSGGWRQYSTIDTGEIITGNVANRVNSFINSYNTLLSDYQKRYSGRKNTYEDAYVSDSASYLDSISKQNSDFKTEYQSILSELDQYSSYLNPEWVESTKKALADGVNNHNKIVEIAKQDNDYWSTFNPNEEQKAAGYTADKIYNEWQTGQKQHTEDLAFDVAAGEVELEKLKKEKTAYLEEQAKKREEKEKNKSWWEKLAGYMGDIQDTTLPLAGVNQTSVGTTYNPYDKLIAEKEQQIARAKYVQGYEGYMDNINNIDYDTSSQYVSTRTDVPLEDATYTVSYGVGAEGAPAMSTMYDKSKLFGDFLYDYINRNEDALDVAMVNDTSDYSYFLGHDKGFLQSMTDDEIGVYNSLYEQDKKNGTNHANEFLDFIESDLEGRRRIQEQARWAAYAKESPVASSVFSTLISPLKGLSYISQAVDMMDDGEMKDDAAYNRFSYIPSTIRSQVSTTIENSGKWGKVGSFAYNTGMSMADFLFTTAVSGGNQALSLGIMGSGAAADATLAAKDRGLDDDQAFTLGTIAGLAEVAMEKISLGAWLEGDMTEGALRYVLKNALSEGGEEAGTSIVNLLADVMIAGDKSEWSMAMQEYMDAGKTEAEAFGLVLAEQATQIGLDALGGALSGSAIGGGTYAGTSTVAKFQYGDIGKNKAQAQKLVAEGMELNPTSQYVKKAQSKVEKGKNLSGMQVRNILAANQEQITANDMKKIQQAAEKRLTDLGQTEKVSEVAEIATKWATGQEITRAEKKLLTHSQYGSRVANELLPENIASDDYSTGWAEEIGTESVNKAAYNKKAIRTLIDAMANAEDSATYKSLEERVGTESSLKVSKNGQATIRESGEAIDLNQAEVVDFVKDKKGNIVDMTVKVDGKEVKASEIDYADGDQSYLFEAVSKIENITPAAATAIVRDYDPSSGQSVGEYLNGIDEGYTYGYYGYTEADLKAGEYAPKLTGEQMTSAYMLGQSAKKISGEKKAEAFKRMRTAVEAEAEKAMAEGKEAPKAKNLTITYNRGNGEVISIDEAGITDAKQSGAVEVAKILHKMGLGTKVEFFSSNVKKDADGNEIRVFVNDAGVEQKAYSGVYRKADGTIRIDLNAYNGRGLTLNALAHEMTHFIQQWSEAKYKVLADFLIKAYEKTDMTMHERVLREQARLEGIRGESVSYDEAFDEVVANAMSKMFDDGKLVERLTELKAQDEKLARKLWEGFKKILAKFLGIYEEAGPLFKDTADLMAMKETFEQLQNMFAEALVEASDNYQASLTASESQTLTEAGIGFDEDTKSVYSLHFSTAYQDVIQVGKKTFDTEAIAQVVAKGTGRSIEDARKWVKSELTIANMVMANPEFLDFEADNRYEAIKKNSDYPQGTVDLSNLCPKREEFTTMFDMLQKKYPNKLFTAQDIAEMRKILAKNDITVACGACFVEDRRQLIGEIADTFIGMWKEAVESGKPLQKTNAEGKKSDLLVTKALAKQYGLTAGAKIMGTDTYIPNQYDLTTYEGFKLLEKNHPTIAMAFNRYNNSRGQQSARLIEGRAEYKRQVLGWSDAKVRSVNNNGGLRIFSFSDFEVVHLLDLVQVIIDCAARGVKIQGYTKIPAFAKLVRGTGIKLNRSLIPKGDYGFHMENGKVVLDYDTTEGIDINDRNFIDESNNPDVGNIVIGINPTQIGAAMLDSFIDYIIPFHSNKAKEILKKLGTGEWVNYKESQHEKDISTGKASKHNVNIYTEVINKYHPTNKVEFVEAFLKECKRQGKIPRYAEFLNVDANGDYAYREGYHKLLVDFKMFDAEGNILPQENITPSLDEAFMKDLLNAEIDKKQNYEFPQEVYDDIDKQFGEQYASQETDADSYDYTKSFAEQVDDWMNGKFPDIDTLLVGRTPEVLRSIGIPSLPVTIAQRNLKDNLLGQYRGTPDEIADHLITPEEMKKLPEKIADPVAIIVDRRQVRGKWVIQESTIDILVEMEINGKQALVPIRLNGNARQNGTLIDANVVTSVHGNKDTVDRLDYALKNDSDENVMVFYVNKKKTTAVLRKAGYTITGVPNISDGFNHSIHDSGSPVKLRINSQTETRQFKHWFKGSKVVDKEGNPLIVYHGTPYMFTAFDTSNGRYGIYLTANKQLASSYGGNIMEAYASITKPKYIDAAYALAKTMDISKIAREAHEEGYDGLIISNLIHAGNANYDVALWELAPEAMKEKESAEDSIRKIDEATGYIDKIYDITESEYSIPSMPLLTEPDLLWWAQKESGLMYDERVSKKLAKLQPIQKEIATHVDRYNRAIEAIRKAENENASSIADTVYVAFESGQVKDAHNNIGTFDRNNPDTLFSSQETDRDGNTMSDRAREILANAKPKMIGKNEKANIEFDTVRELFNELNADKDIQALADRVFKVAKEDHYGYYGYGSYGEPKSHLRLPMAFVGKDGIPDGVHGQFRKNTIWGDIVFSYDYFMDESVAPQSKASTILHEVIHAITCSHIESAYRWSQARNGMFADPLAITDFDGVDERIKAGIELIDAFEQVRSAPTKDGKNLYGQLTVYEMVAEMANVEFRNFLKKQNLWNRIVETIKRIFGIPKTTAYDAVSDALERILTETTNDADVQRAKIEAKKANNRYSSQETDLDTNGKKLGEDQLEYFENSLVRDRNGRLQVVYHGGTVEFEFDTTRGGKGATQYGPGAYFTDSEYYAKEYTWYRGGDVKAYYLKIEKMFDDTNMDATVQMPQWKKLEQILRSNGIEDKFIEGFKNGGFAYMSRYLALKAGAKTSSSWEGSEQLNAMLREAGFDGIKGELNDVYQYAIFTPNQAKLTTNEVPSTFYDTRYSEHETDYTNRSLLANAFEGLSRSSVEYGMIQEYKDNIKVLNLLEKQLSDLNAEIREIRFTKGKYDAKKLQALEEKAKRIAKDINKQDKTLLNMEASEPLRKVIEYERKKASQKTKDHVKEIQQNKKLRAEQTELRHKIRKAVRDLDKLLNRGNKKTNVKEDMKDFASKALELADYLFTDHISNDDLIRKGITVRMTAKEAALAKETEDILSQLYDNADSLTDEEFARLDAKRKANEDKLRDLLTAQRNERLNTPVAKLFDDLVKSYASLKNSNQDAVKAAYSEELENSLRAFISDENRVKILENMRVADMTTEELNWLYRAYTMVLTNVRNANKLFVKGKQESIEKTVSAIVTDFTKRKAPDGKVAIVARNIANKIGWDYEKLYYALDRIGSEAFTELIMNLANSENTIMQDVMEAAAFRDQIVENYGFNNWDVNKKIDKEFLDNTGKKFKLTLGQLMSLYAYSRRKGAWDHIEYGGFVFGEKALTDPRPADSYKLSQAQCEAITNTLTKEQKGYVEEMQKFLSETMGAKGNEVSMMLYGIKMFGEKNYFPIHIAGQYKAQANESQAKATAGFSSMTNAGFTHEQNPNAKAPFVLEGFNEIWADHVNEMSRYHGAVPAMEDLRRVMNRSSYSDAYAESMSVKAMMENSFGKEAVEYFDNLYREANSGAITDKLQKWPKKLLSLFRKNSVAYSLSVLIQQPASLVRAYALIDRKYFGVKGFGTITSGIAKAVSNKWTKAHTNAYNEMLKYAPGVTMAKEIGGFDTHTGSSIRSYLLDTGKSFKQSMKTENLLGKGKAVLDLVDDNAIANLPNVADKIAWIEIWNACKRETVAKHKDLATSSDEFMQIVGDRFTEVIRATQVYDSIFAKSPMLKSKNLAVQYLVSFMNEPNTIANMVEKAMRDVTNGNWKSGARTAAVVIHSIIFTGVLKSIIYAMRDDDEDETYIEKYIEAITGGMMDDLNALNYIPLVRDAWSLAQGYDVERADMAIVADAIDALGKVFKNATTDTDDMTEEQLIEFDKKCTEANWKLVESLSSFIGIPVKNIRREIVGVIDHARIASANAGMTTASSLWDKVTEEVLGSIPGMSTKEAKTDKLYGAIISGDKTYLDRLKGTYKTDDAYNSAVRKALRENDPRIHEAAQARYDGNTEEYKRIFREIKNEGKFTFDDIMSAVNSEESKIRNKLEPEKVTSQYGAGDFVEAVAMGNTTEAQAMRDDIIATKVANGMTQEEAEKEFASSVATDIGNGYSSGLLDEAQAEKMLREYAGKDEEEAASKVNYWSFLNAHPEYEQYDLSESNVNKYLEFAEPEGISMEVFVQFRDGTKGLTDIKDKWGDVEVSKREQVLEVIDSLPLTWQQKDALYLAAGYSENKIWDVPW